MKKILSILLLFISVAAISQPSNYLNIRSRYNLIAVKTDSGFHVPGYSTIPNYRGGVWSGAGNVGVDTVNHKFYFYSGGSWREAGATYTFTNGITESGGTVTLTNDTTAFANSFYGTNAVGRRGYRPLSEIIPTLQQVLTAGNFATADSFGISGTNKNVLSISKKNAYSSNYFGSISLKFDADQRELLLTSNSISFKGISSGYGTGLFAKAEPTRNSTVVLPDTTGNLAMSVLLNGVIYNANDIGRINLGTITGGSASGNYGNVQLNRNGVFSTPSSDSLTFSDKLNVKGNIIGTNKLILGATSAPAQSQIYVTGGLTGGNIDARGDSTSEARDEANIEVEHPDYDGVSHNANGVAMQTNGNVTTGSLLTYPKKNSGQLRFTNETNIIRVIPNRSLRFATNNIERAVLDSNGRLGIGVKLPTTTLDVAGTFKLVDGTQGAGKILTSDANGGASWQTPATVADTSYTTIATFTAGGGFASDTTMCTDSTLFGSFFTGQFDYTISYIQAVIKGNAGDSIVLKLVYNDTFNVDGTKVNGAGLSVNNRYTGNTFTISTNRTVPANTWLWLKPEAVITGKKPKYISVTLIGYKTYVTP